MTDTHHLKICNFLKKKTTMKNINAGFKNTFLPGSKPSTVITFYTISSPFPISNPIQSLYLSLLLDFSFLPFLISPSFPSTFPFFSLTSPFLPFVYPFLLPGNLSISATILVSPLFRYFIFLSPVLMTVSHS